MFPSNSIWNTPIDRLPVHPQSAVYIRTVGEARTLHPDFGTRGAIPVNIVPANQPAVSITFTYPAESDPGPYPVPDDARVESGSDAHVLVVQQGTCRLYELFAAARLPAGGWKASTGAVFDLRSNALRPDGWTSADAAGLPITAGLVRFDEVAAGEIRHALRLTVPRTRRQYVWPARHYASTLTGSEYPSMGQRFRLKAGYDISGFDPQVQVILRALKKYGLILADNGSSWFITGEPDSRWNDEILAQLKRVTGADLEAVDVSPLMVGPNSAAALNPFGTAPAAAAYSATPVFDLAASPVQTITLTGDVISSTAENVEDGQTVNFIICQDSLGGRAFQWPENVRGGMTVGQAPGKCSAQQFTSLGRVLYAVSPGVPDM